MYKLDLMDIALLIGSGFALLFFVVLVSFTKKKLSNIFLGLFSGSIFFVLFKGVIHANEYHLHYPSLFFLPVYWTTGFGSFLFFYIKCIIDKSCKIEQSIILPFVPLFFQIGFHAFWYFHSPEEKQNFYENKYFFDLLLYEEIIAILVSSIYTLLAFIKVSTFLKSKGRLLTPHSLKIIRWSKKLIILFSIMILFLWIGYTVYDFFGSGYTLPYAAYYPIYFFIVSFIGWIAIGVMSIPQIMNEPIQYSGDLEGLDENTALKSKIEKIILPHIFDSDKQLPTVEALASKINWSKQYTSLYFEIHFGMSYQLYVKMLSFTRLFLFPLFLFRV